jgi:hypothetical protein
MLSFLLFVSSCSPDLISSGSGYRGFFVPHGSSLFVSCHVRQDESVRLTFSGSGAVLSILDQHNFAIYVGRAEPTTGGVSWSMAPTNSVGFIALGDQGQSIASIVASAECDLRFAAVYVGDTPGTCRRVLAGHSSTFESVTPGTCFLSTDIESSVSVDGSGSVIVATYEESTIYNGTNPIPPTGIFIQPFSIVMVEGVADDLAINFSGGDSQMLFDAVDNQTVTGVVGKGQKFGFVYVSGKPNLGGVSSDPATLLLVIGLILSAGILVGGCMLIYCGAILRKRDETEDETSSAPLYDERPDLYNDELDGEGDADVGKTGGDDEVEYRSPYETL